MDTQVTQEERAALLGKARVRFEKERITKKREIAAVIAKAKADKQK